MRHIIIAKTYPRYRSYCERMGFNPMRDAVYCQPQDKDAVYRIMGYEAKNVTIHFGDDIDPITDNLKERLHMYIVLRAKEESFA